ncbi:MAG: hypothetical protein ACTSRA_03865 [Promethearchaeota archaeon]
MSKKRIIIISTIIIISACVTIVLILVPIFQARKCYKSIDDYIEDSAFSNPNLRFAKPVAENNQIVFYDGYIEVDSLQNASNWFIAQWQVSDPLLPNASNEANLLNDASLGESIYYQETSDAHIGIFLNDDNKSYAYELKLAGGQYTTAGGRNLFISGDIEDSIRMDGEVFVNFSVKIKELYAGGDAPDHVAQVFIGLIFKCWNNSTGHDDTLFIQGIISNTHGCTFYAAGNPSIKCGLYSRTILPELVPQGTDKFTPLLMPISQFLDEALPRSYPWEDEDGSHVTTYPDQNPEHWFMTEIYVGLETQGNATACLQIKDFHLLEQIPCE